MACRQGPCPETDGALPLKWLSFPLVQSERQEAFSLVFFWETVTKHNKIELERQLSWCKGRGGSKKTCVLSLDKVTMDKIQNWWPEFVILVAETEA